MSTINGKNCLLRTRVTEAQRGLLDLAAQKTGRSISDLVRQGAFEYAATVLAAGRIESRVRMKNDQRERRVKA